MVTIGRQGKWTGVMVAAASLLIGSLSLLAILQQTQEFCYYYREQQQVFIFDADYILGLLSSVGGFSTFVSQWLVQFFVVPYMGASITAILCLTAAVFVSLALCRCTETFCWIPLAIVPAALYSICLQDSYVHYEGLVALVIGCIWLWIYSMAPQDKWAFRLCLGSVLMPSLFFLCGSIAVLVSMTLVLYDVARRASKAYWGFIPLAFVLLSGLVAVNRGWLIDYPYAYWAKAYCEYYFEPTWLHHLAWLSLPLVVLVACLCSRWRPQKAWMQLCVTTSIVAVFYIGCHGLAVSRQNRGYYALQQQIHYADTEQWDKLVGVTGINPANDPQMIYLNLGLSHQGCLLEDLFIYPQQGIRSLTSNDVQYIDVVVMMSRVYYQMGMIGAAQDMSFSAMIGITWGNPSIMKQLIKTYLINGNYLHAERQIEKLEKSWYYAEWATSQRRFLYNDEAVMADPELGKLRRSLPDNDEFTIINGPLYDLQMVLDANPENREAAEYFIAMLLITKNYPLINAFVNRYYGQGCMTTLPLRLQEAMAAIHEKDPEYCRTHGVSENVLQRFANFRQQVLALRRKGITSVASLAPEYRRTFWYYMLK